MPVVICNYDQLKSYVVKLRREAAEKAQTDQTPYSRSFHNGEVAAYDRIFVSLLSWEKYEEGPWKPRGATPGEGVV